MSEAVRAHFRRQAQSCAALGSPFTESLCNLLAKILDKQTAIGRLVLKWGNTVSEDALALRLCGALHRLVLTEKSEELRAVYPPSQTDEHTLREVVSTTLAVFDDWLCAQMASPPQTNEIARSAMLLPGLLEIAARTQQPIALYEIGASAGLNLLLDRFGYQYGSVVWGDGQSPVCLAPEVDGDVSLPPAAALEIVTRLGCDVAPIDLRDDVQRQRLRSFVWPDQSLRLERLDAAISVAERAPAFVLKCDAEAFVRAQLDAPRPGVARVLMHSIMWQYLPRATREEIEGALERLGDQAQDSTPLFWLRMEPHHMGQPHAVLSLTSWPEGMTRDLAHCDYHGRWIRFLQP